MPYINIVMSLMDFIPYTNDIISKNNGILYVEKANDNNSFSNIAVNVTNYKSIIEPNRGERLNFFISSRELEDITSNLYEDKFCHHVIEGIGGRETEDFIERISLRLISKKPDKEIKRIFNSINNKLKKDESIGVGVRGGSSLHKNYYYKKSCIGNKIFKTDINNDKAPIIVVE